MSSERRRFPRVAETLEVRYRGAGALDEPWRAGTAISLSAGGLRFRSEDAFPAGTLLSLKLRLPGGAEPTAVNGQVAWSQLQASGVTEVGVEFLDATEPQRALIDQLVAFLNKRV
ncbi:MAG: PilZ domain-containing protein [Candidatus Omnitrophica bacterium]|nr:PilZ domain-containing protein [Candidatus Omnitrophota bacterium]